MNCPIVAQNETEVKYKIGSNEDRIFRPRYNISIRKQISLYKEARTQPQETSGWLALLCEVEISISQINRIRKGWGLNRKRGRPRKKQAKKLENSRESAVISHTPQAGVGLFAMWLQEQQMHNPVLAKLYQVIEQYKVQHPQERLRLLQAKQDTIAKKWQALIVLPLLGIAKLSELDYKPHNMRAVLGYSYGSSTLTQFIGELERVGAQALRFELANAAVGQYCYIDGHMLAFWSRCKMHKGLITMNGRIMPGSKALLAHDARGNAIGLDYCPPDTHLSKAIADYCTDIESATGIKQFVIDREVNSADMARLFVEHGWELICLLNANEYNGLDSFNKRFAGCLEDGTLLYKATWKHYREGDCRQFVLAKEPDRCLAYWSTPKIADAQTAKETVTVYRSRTEIQENNIKRMIAHGALNTNYGIKKIVGEDRTQQRKLDKLQTSMNKMKLKEQKLEHAVALQHNKIQASEDNEHHKFLDKRRAKLTRLEQQQKDLAQKVTAVGQEKQKLGLPGQRADRDFRKQTIMTFRTLWLENAIKFFFALIFAALKAPLDIEVALDLFCFRPGMMVEQGGQFVYYLDCKGLSVKYQAVLHEMLDGFNRISLSHQGKQVVVQSLGFT